MAAISRRFITLDKPIEHYIQEQQNKNTLSKTRGDVTLLSELIKQKKVTREVKEIDHHELNKYLCNFFKGKMKKWQGLGIIKPSRALFKF